MRSIIDTAFCSVFASLRVGRKRQCLVILLESLYDLMDEFIYHYRQSSI